MIGAAYAALKLYQSMLFLLSLMPDLHTCWPVTPEFLTCSSVRWNICDAQEFLGVPKGQDVKLVPSGYPGLAYLPYTDTGLTITVGFKDPNAFPRHLFGCPFPPSRTGACVPPANCDCDKDVRPVPGA